MIEPYSRDIRCCKIKRYHELIFKMWYECKTNIEIAAELRKLGCHTNRKGVGKKLHLGRRRCYYMQMTIRKHAYKLGKSLGLRGADGIKQHPRTESILRMFKEK